MNYPGAYKAVGGRRRKTNHDEGIHSGSSHGANWALTLLFGRVFCHWICPYGTLHQFIGWLFNIGGTRDRIGDNRYRPMQFFK